MDTLRALEAAAFVQAAYQTEPVLPDGYELQVPLYGDDYAGTFQEGQAKTVFGYVATSEHETVIAIRGTETVEEWAQDARYAKEPWKPGYAGLVEAGFWDLYKSLSNVSAYLEGARPLRIVGHSLGAAMALLMAADYAAYRPEVYAFAPPNPGDQAFADWFASNVPDAYRIVNLTDSVPHLPPTLMGFRPAGASVLLNVLEDPVTSHDMATYIAALQQGRFLVFSE